MLISKPSGQFGILSPYASTPFYGYRSIVREGRPGKYHDFYPTITHFYLSEKFRGNEKARQSIMAMQSTREVEKRARQLSKDGYERADWERVKMMAACAAIRFAMASHQQMYELLMLGETEIRYLSNTNREMGVGHNEKGLNVYGKALEEIRNKIQNNTFTKAIIMGMGEVGSLDNLDKLFSAGYPDYVYFDSENLQLAAKVHSWAQVHYITPSAYKNIEIRPGMLTHAVIIGNKNDPAAVAEARRLNEMDIKVRITN